MSKNKVVGRKADGACTTQRVGLETLNRIKTLNYHLYTSKRIRLSQADLIANAIRFALSQEAEFLEYVESGKILPKETAFDTLVNATGKPWFPYGNIFKVE
jgi:hypothetical protein